MPPPKAVVERGIPGNRSTALIYCGRSPSGGEIPATEGAWMDVVESGSPIVVIGAILAIVTVGGVIAWAAFRRR